MSINGLVALLAGVSAIVNNERELQDRVASVLARAGVAFIREARAETGGRYDFLCLALKAVIETKTKDGRSKVLRQIKSYADAPGVNYIIVMSRQPLALPARLSGKQIYNVPLWKNFA